MTKTKKNNWAVVILCAGQGKRLKSGQEKAWVKIKSKPIFSYSLESFLSFKLFKYIVLVVSQASQTKIKGYLIGQGYPQSKLHIVIGGARRQDSVFNALEYLKDKQVDKIVIHDAARPFVSKKLIHKVIKNGQIYSAVAVGLKIRDALKKEYNGYISKSIRREGIVAIQTPQAYNFQLLENAYKKYNNQVVYDDAQLVEKLGKRVKFIEGEWINFKITYPDDLKLARRLVIKDCLPG